MGKKYVVIHEGKKVISIVNISSVKEYRQVKKQALKRYGIAIKVFDEISEGHSIISFNDYIN